MQGKGQQPTMHWQNTGQDNETSALTTWQQWSGAGLFLNNFSVIL
jgi:hypothetical protein